MDHHRDTETQRSDSYLTEQVIAACIEVHRHLGPGLLEGIYEECVCDRRQVRNPPLPPLKQYLSDLCVSVSLWWSLLAIGRFDGDALRGLQPE